MKKQLLFAAAAVLSATAAPATADWQYVKWGMSTDQAIQASKGEAKATSGGGEVVCAFTDQKPVAYVPRKEIGSIPMIVVICAGQNGKVNSVTLRPITASASYNPLRTALTGTYGTPTLQEGRGDSTTTTWRDEKGKNLIRLNKVIDMGAVEYRAIPTGF